VCHLQKGLNLISNYSNIIHTNSINNDKYRLLFIRIVMVRMQQLEMLKTDDILVPYP